MPICRKCDVKFPNKMIVDGKERNMQRRKFCISCSPFGSHNTKTSVTVCQTKECPLCCKVLQISDFYTKSDRKSGNTYCKSCFNEYQSIRWILKKIKAIDYLGGKCKDCNVTNLHPALYDFHHREPDYKDFDWTKLRLMSYSNIKCELDKCDLLCVMCHRLKHLNHMIWEKAFTQLKYSQQDSNLRPTV